MVATRSSASGESSKFNRSEPGEERFPPRKRKSPAATSGPSRKTRKRKHDTTAKLSSCTLCLNPLPSLSPDSDCYSLSSELRFFGNVGDLCSTHDIVDKTECRRTGSPLCHQCFALLKACDEQYGLFLERVEVCRVVRQRSMGRCRVLLESGSTLRSLLEEAKESASQCKDEYVECSKNNDRTDLDDLADVKSLMEVPVVEGEQKDELDEDLHIGLADSPTPFDEVFMAGDIGVMAAPGCNPGGSESWVPLELPQPDQGSVSTDVKEIKVDESAAYDAFQFSNASNATVNVNEAALDDTAASHDDEASLPSCDPGQPSIGPKPPTLKVLRWCETGANAENSAPYTEYSLRGFLRGYVVEGFFFTRCRASQFEKDVVLVRCCYKSRGSCPVWGAVNLAEKKFYYSTLLSVASHNHTEDGIQFAKQVPTKIKRKKKKKSRAMTRPPEESNVGDDEYPVTDGQVQVNWGRKREHLICVECSLQKANPTALYRHYRSAHVIPGGVVCRECGRSFHSDQELEEHEQEHYQQNFDRVSCITCRFVVRRESHIYHVQNVHSHRTARTMDERREMGVEIMRCAMDSFWTTTIQRFELHAVQYHEGPDDKPFLCMDCGESFKARLYLRAHRAKEHTNEPAYRCRECGEGFLDRKTAEKHVAEHRVEKGIRKRKFLCPDCGAVFDARMSWRAHMVKAHDALEQHGFQCPECPEKFETYVLKRKHVEDIHGGPPAPKFYPRKIKTCPECGAKTRSNIEYIGHMRLRHGVSVPGMKEYPCVLCGRLLFSGKQLRDHEKKSHGLHYAAYKRTGLLCNLCDFACPDRNDFREHLLAAHQQKVVLKKLWVFMKKPEVSPAEETPRLLDDALVWKEDVM